MALGAPRFVELGTGAAKIAALYLCTGVTLAQSIRGTAHTNSVSGKIMVNARSDEALVSQRRCMQGSKCKSLF
jgi:hypothetical protein